MPAPQHLDDVVVDFATQESHGAAGAKGSGGDLFGRDARVDVIDDRCVTENISDIFGFDSSTAVGVRVVGGKGRALVGAVLFVVQDTANGGTNRDNRGGHHCDRVG